MFFNDRIRELPENHPRRIAFEQAEQERLTSPAYVEREVVLQAQSMLDSFARTRGYDGILSACSYVSSAVPQFAAEAARCVTLRDQVWATCYTIMAAVKAGTRTMPTVEQAISELPALTWE